MFRIIIIVFGILVICVVILGSIMFSALSGAKPGIRMPEETLGLKGKKILLAYASKAGATGEAAVIIGKEIAEQGAIVEVRQIDSVSDVSRYDAFVLGTAIRAGKPLSEFTKFITKNKKILNEKPVAIFLTCMTLSKDTPETRKKVEKYFDTVKMNISPKAEGYFGGRMDYSKLNFLTKFIVMNIVKIPEGDFINEKKLKKWAVSTANEIK
jgi:menaquinone-dependent protoporphyrinogen oxidase